MIRTFFGAVCLVLACLAAAPSAAFVPVGPRASTALPVTATHVAMDADRLRKSCRSKVRRQLGPAKGRHAGMLRIAFTEQCVGNGGRLA